MKLHQAKMAMLARGGAAGGVGSAAAGAGLARAPPPYWATPQCVLKRHLLEHLKGLRMVDCMRPDGGPAVLRLIRPR